MNKSEYIYYSQGKIITKIPRTFRSWNFWCGWRDSNPHAKALAPKASASANSATPASKIILIQYLNIVKEIIVYI